MSSIHNYTLQDIAGTIAAIPVFAIFLCAPGYCFGLASNVMGFRGRSATEKILLSLPFSIVISIMVVNLVGRYVPARFLLWCFLLSAAWLFLHVAIQWFRQRQASPRKLPVTTKMAIGIAILWMLVVVISLVDIQWCGRLYVSTTVWDHAVRVAFVRSALRSGPPPTNPFCYLGFAPTSRYYYYWYVLCSYPARLAHIDARYVLYGSSAWAGICLMALIPIYLKDFFGTTNNLRRRSILGILLLYVTGLDIVPTAYEFLRTKSIAGDMEWWDPVQITSWTDALIWAPHHVAALVACLIGFLVLWSLRRKEDGQNPSFKMRMLACFFAALAFAVAAGLSVYVTFTFAIFLCCWSLRFLYKRVFSDFLLYLSTGCLTIAISLPYLHDLLSSGAIAGATVDGGASSGAGSARFIQFGLRELPSFLSTPYFLKVRGFSHPFLLFPFGLLAVYILEFGFFAIVGWFRLKRDLRDRSNRNEAEIASWYLLAASMFVITFVRSSVISNNDLGFRSAMIAQFVLLLWGAEYIDRWLFSRPFKVANLLNAKNTVAFSTLVLGCMGTIYSLGILRTYTMLDDRGWIAQPADWLPPPPNVGRDLFHVRQAYQKLDRVVSANSIVQYNPMTADYISLLMYTKFQSVDGFPDCGTEFGGSTSACLPVQAVLANLFNRPGAYDIHPLCAKLSIDALVVRASDPAWQDRTSWVWSHEPIIENQYIRIFQCR